MCIFYYKLGGCFLLERVTHTDSTTPTLDMELQRKNMISQKQIDGGRNNKKGSPRGYYNSCLTSIITIIGLLKMSF